MTMAAAAIERHRAGAPRSALGPHPAAGRDGRRRADARHARPHASTRSREFYEAPIQLKANGGVFLVDDFGRQRMRPEDLLNRWIVPLESRVDYLTLHTGKKFEVPFDVLTVFATNLDPASLADEAFLRRIPHKIPVERPGRRGVHAHLRAELHAAAGCRFHQVMVAHFYRRHYRPLGTPDARLPPARPAGADHRAVPHRGIAPAGYSRADRRGVCVYFVDGCETISTDSKRSSRDRARQAAAHLEIH